MSMCLTMQSIQNKLTRFAICGMFDMRRNAFDDTYSRKGGNGSGFIKKRVADNDCVLER